MCAKSQSERQSEILQKLQDVGDVLREAREHAQYFEALKNACFLDGYCEGSLALILNMNVALESDDVGSGICDGHTTSVQNLTVLISYNDSLDANVWGGFEQQEVFVKDIEFVKGIDNASLPSSVRLYVGSDFIKERRASGIYFSPMKGCFKFLSSLADGEFGEFRTSSGDMSFDCAHPCEVKSGMEIVDGIANYQRQIQKSIFETWERVYQLLLTSLKIFLNPSSVTFFEREDSSLQLCDMFIGPINLQSGVPKRCTHNKEVITFG
jgi:hypothetical protein